MYLKLTISKGSGYISTFDDNDKSIVCKPTSSDDVSKMAQDYSMNENYVVGMEEDKDGSMNWIVEDKANPRKLLEAQQTGMQQAGKKADDSKQSLEFSRYKQDCRKRALEMAHVEKYSGTFIATNATPEKIQEVADKYYNWLISIPEK